MNGSAAITRIDEKNPWELKILARDMNKNEYEIRLSISKDKDTGNFVFTFSRISGNLLKFKKIWQPVEDHMLAAEEFKDEFDMFEESADQKDPCGVQKSLTYRSGGPVLFYF